ncbi:MAG TPA: hypothetical protein ENI74_08730 [Gammaproteobacteria bacterium]|nr:hypothetical protein [Gammaproteobacteria bacterium]
MLFGIWDGRGTCPLLTERLSASVPLGNVRCTEISADSNNILIEALPMAAVLYYSNMQHFTLRANGKDILCDGEGYLLDLDAWPEDYVIAAAERGGLELTDKHWQVIRLP